MCFGGTCNWRGVGNAGERSASSLSDSCCLLQAMHGVVPSGMEPYILWSCPSDGKMLSCFCHMLWEELLMRQVMLGRIPSLIATIQRQIQDQASWPFDSDQKLHLCKPTAWRSSPGVVQISTSGSWRRPLLFFGVVYREGRGTIMPKGPVRTHWRYFDRHRCAKVFVAGQIFTR
jgi:hypothetical protein